MSESNKTRIEISGFFDIPKVGLKIYKSGSDYYVTLSNIKIWTGTDFYSGNKSFTKIAIEKGEYAPVKITLKKILGEGCYEYKAIKASEIPNAINSYFKYAGTSTNDYQLKRIKRLQNCLEEFNTYVLPELYPVENKNPAITEMTPEQLYALGRRGELIVKRRLETEGCYVERADDMRLEKGAVDFYVKKTTGVDWFAEVKVRAVPYDISGVKSFYVAKYKIEEYADYAANYGVPLTLYILDIKGRRILTADIDDLLAETAVKTTKGVITFPYETEIPNATNNPQLNFWEEQFEVYDTLTDEECDYILNCDEDPLEEVNAPTVTEKGEEPATNKTEHIKSNDVVTFPNTNTNKEAVNNMPDFTCADVDKKLAQITEMKKSLAVIKKYISFINLKEVEEILTKSTGVGVMPVLSELKPFVSNLEPFLDAEEQNAHIALVESIMAKRGYKVIYEKIDK